MEHEEKQKNPRWKGRLRCEASLIFKGLKWALKKAPEHRFQEKNWGRGSLFYESGIPVIRLCGTPQEIGEQQGKILGSEIRLLFNDYVNNFFTTESKLSKARKVSANLEKYIDERYKEELFALASASGIDYSDALLSNTFLDLYKTVLCSTLVTYGKASYDGSIIFGRNLDFPNIGNAHSMSILTVYNSEKEIPFISVGWPGLIGVLSGMNAYGLTLAVMLVHDGREYKPGVPFTILFRKILGQASNIDEALTILKNAPFTTGNNLMLASPSPDACVAEIFPGYFQVRRPVNEAIFSTNHFQSKEAPCKKLSLFYLSSFYRYKRLEAFLENYYGKINVDSMIHALSNVAIPGINLQSMVFTKNSIHLSIGKVPATSGPFTEISLEKFFK